MRDKRGMRGKGPAGGKCAPYAPYWVLRVLLRAARALPRPLDGFAHAAE
jgi:hypothetical protein